MKKTLTISQFTQFFLFLFLSLSLSLSLSLLGRQSVMIVASSSMLPPFLPSSLSSFAFADQAAPASAVTKTHVFIILLPKSCTYPAAARRRRRRRSSICCHSFVVVVVVAVFVVVVVLQISCCFKEVEEFLDLFNCGDILLSSDICIVSSWSVCGDRSAGIGKLLCRGQREFL
jgi:hypothetical protein